MEVFRFILNLHVVLFLHVSFKNVHTMPIFTTQMYMNRINNDSYMVKREEILLAEQHERVGGEIVLTPAEQVANKILMAAKKAEIDGSLVGGRPFAPAVNFLVSRPLVEQSEVFKIIQKMPKGGALHVHDISIVDVTWIVNNATYRDNCYMCYDANKTIKFHFFQTPPANPGCPWQKVSVVRQASPDPAKFDVSLYESMVLTGDTLQQNINTVWKRFEEILIRATDLINHRPVFKDYYTEALHEFYEDNVQYIEIRALLPELYELDGSTHTSNFTMQLYKTATEEFLAQKSDFTGAKIIKTNLRKFPPSVILDDIKKSIVMKSQFPQYFAGYDLVGQEDPGEPLLYYLDALRYPAQQNPPIDLPYFFHAGETDWQGTKVDDNLIDAVLLNTSRIGHGYALPKHPRVMQIVKDKQIAIEVNPISNQVLKLVDDLRNHPASVLIAEGYPVVISSDDPAVWGARGLSYDFYAAFMALAGEDADLTLLKQLAINSLGYSAMSQSEKVAALVTWEAKWATFITGILQSSLKYNIDLVG